MLVLTRKLGEKVMISPNITVQIVGVKGKQVRLGIDAPEDVGIFREEIYNEFINSSDDDEDDDENND